MGQIIGSAAKPKRCNLNQLSQWGTPAAGEHILVSSDNSMNAAGQGNFDCYIIGDDTTAATALPLQYIENVVNNLTDGGENIALSAEQGKVLNLKIEGAQKEVTTESVEVAVSSYTNFFFSKPMPAGAVITSVSGISRNTGVYLMRANGTFATPLIGQLTLPYTTPEEFAGVKANGTFTITLTYTIGEDVEGVKPMLEELSDEVDDLSAATSQIVEAFGSKPAKTFSVQGAASYAEVLFDEILPAGSVIMSFTTSANVSFYLTDTNGNYDTALISSQLINKLPYTTTKDYRGIKSSSAALITFNLAPLYGIDGNRKQIKVSTTDSQIEILEKFRYAFFYGNIDIFFEHGTYTLDEVYQYMKNTLKWTWTMGLPVGNGCRYFFNGSTIISNAPASTYSDNRNILDTKASSSSFEVHDATLIINGGTYCLHDEAYNKSEPYLHIYDNVKFVSNGGTRAVGVGTGFNASFIFKSCNFINSAAGFHAPTSNPNEDPVTIDIIMDSCYFTDGKDPLSINPDQIDTSRDDVTLQVSNCRFTKAITASTLSCVNTLKLFNNQNT